MHKSLKEQASNMSRDDVEDLVYEKGMTASQLDAAVQRFGAAYEVGRERGRDVVPLGDDYQWLADGGF